MRVYISITVLFLVFFVFSAPVLGSDTVKDQQENEKPVLTKIVINISNAPDNASYFKELAKSVIFFKEGEHFSNTLLQSSINALKLSKQFNKIHVDSKENNKNIELIFNLTVSRFIKDIRLKGNYPFFDREILNILTIYTGDMFDEKELTKQVDIISEFFKQKGFFVPGVYITAQQDLEDSQHIITIKISKGPYYSLGKIEIKGNRAFSAIRLKMKLKHFRFSFIPGMVNRFIKRDFSKEIEKLTKFYRKKGFPDASIEYFETLDPDNEEAMVQIIIDEGERYHVTFEGNKEFGKRKLKKNIVIFTNGNKVNFGIRKSIRKIKNLYLQAGYLETRVRVEEEVNKKEKTKLLKFIIHEGPRTVVEAIEISGNKEFTTRKIKKQMLTSLPGTFKIIEKGEYVPDVLADDVNAIQSMYHKRGFLPVQVDKDVHLDKTGKKAKIKISIIEGQKIVVSSVVIKSISAIPLKKAYQTIQLKKDTPFRETLMTEDENSLSALIAEKGFPYVQVKGSVHINNGWAEIEYQVDEGVHVKMGQVYCTGNFRTKETIIRNEINIKPEAPFSLIDMLESQRNIQNMDIFNSTSFKTIGLKEKQNTINLFIEVEENKPYYLEFGSGFKSDTGFFGKVGAGDHNLFGTNKDAHIHYEGRETGKIGEMGILEPRFLGTRIAADLTFDAEQEEEFNKDYGTKTYGTALGFHRKWLKNITTGLTTRLERIYYYPIAPMAEIESEESEKDKFTITPSITYDTRDSFIRPKKGILTAFSVDISTDEFTIFKEKIDSLYDFMKYYIDLRYYATPVKPLTLAWRGMVGYIFPYNSVEWVQEEQLLFLGGVSSVRGFDENMLVYEYDSDSEGNPKGEPKAKGGLFSVLGSIEARFDLGFNFELTLFIDTGQIDNSNRDEIRKPFNIEKLRSSAGFGLRYHTPIGPIGALYGKKLDPLEGEVSDKIHFSLGYTF